MFVTIRLFRFLFDDENVHSEGTRFMSTAISAMVVLKNRSPVGSSSGEVAADIANAVGASDHAASADDTKSAAPASPELTTEVDGTWICIHCSRLNEKPTGKAKTQNLM
jgi:hypothetical protein